MKDFDHELFLQRFERLLNSGDSINKGTIVKVGKRVQVNIGQGRYVEAENLGVLTPGEVGVVKNDGKWYVYPLKENAVISSRTIHSRNYKQKIIEDLTYPFKVLFSVESDMGDGIYHTEYYVAGDRPTPTKIADIRTRFDEIKATYYAWLTNTGTGKNDFIFAHDRHDILGAERPSSEGEGLYTKIGREPLFRLPYDQSFNQENLTFVPFYIGYGVWYAYGDVTTNQHSKSYTIYKELVYKSDTFVANGSVYLLPDPDFLKPQTRINYLMPLMTNEVRDRAIVMQYNGSTFEGFLLFTRDRSYRINNADNDFFLFGYTGTWVKNSLYAAKLPTDRTLIERESVIDVIRYDLEFGETEVNLSKTTMNKKMLPVKLPEQPANGIVYVWNISYFPASN